MTTQALRGTVTALPSGSGYGQPCSILIDGASTAITVNGLDGYAPTVGDRLLVAQVGSTLEVLQYLNTVSAPSNNATDPLASLIALSGQAFVASEAVVGALPPAPAVPGNVTLVPGIVWLDITGGSTDNGDYFCYTHGQPGYANDWTQVTVPATLALCAGLNFSQSPVGNGTLVLYVDPLAQFITSTAACFPVATSSSAPSTFVPGGGFNIGDVAYQTDTNHWFLYKPTGAYTGTWADWVQITYSATIVLCETLAITTTQASDSLSQAIAQLATDLAVENTTAFVQDLQRALSNAIALAVDEVGLGGTAGLVSVETALDSVASNTPTFLYADDTDSIAGQVMGALALQIVGLQNPAAAQALFSVTDSSWTGTAAKIQAANYLATYQTARFGT